MHDVEIGVLLLALFGIKHFLCDFLWQYPYMARDKGMYGGIGGLHHAGLHGISTFVVLVFIVPYIALWASFIDFIVHYHIDWSKQQLIRGLTPNDRKFWIYFGLDQCLHYLTYVGIIGWALH